jgi:lipopolysaccharide/colanic/teichoic acid biosynthesis glycosyltransferase
MTEHTTTTQRLSNNDLHARASRRSLPAYARIKRILDLLILSITWPAILLTAFVVAIIIKLNAWNEPAIFTQQRAGQDGKFFTMYKFRTMVPNAEQLIGSVQHLNLLEWPDFKVPEDPRVTSIGHFLRSTSLDELPQFYNVLKGDMSLVGPRPASIPVADYETWQLARLSVRPGLTGLWQVRGRGETNFDQRCEIDLDYIQRQSLWLDLGILITTVGCVIRRDGVH